MTNTTTFTVQIIIGDDTCTSVTTVEAENTTGAAFAAEMKFPNTHVQIISIEGPDGCDTDLCENDDHWCCNCDVTHLESDGTCFNCSY